MVYIIERKILRPAGIFLLINISIMGRRIIDNPQFIRIFYNLKRLALPMMEIFMSRKMPAGFSILRFIM